MSLIVEPWYFANYVDNLPSVPALAGGTTVTPGTSNADGTAATLLAAQTFDIHYLAVGFAGMNVNTAAEYCLADVLIDPAAGTAWRALINDLVVGGSLTPTVLVSFVTWYYFPIYIKAGTSIGCQIRTSHSVAPTSPRVLVYAYGNPSRPDAWWCGSGVETLGVTAASSIGTSVTPGNSGALGAWASIGTSTARYGALAWGLNGVDAGTTALQYYFQVGYNNIQIPSAPTISTHTKATETFNPAGLYGPLWCDIPSGTTLQVRGTCSGTAEVWAGGAAVYGVY